MRLRAVGGGLAVLIGAISAPCVATAQVEPYVLVIVDVSASMTADVGSPTVCFGDGTSKLDHAKCAIHRLSQSHGNAVMGLGRFRQTSTDSTCDDGCSITGVSCVPGSPANADHFEMLAPLWEGNAATIASWVDGSCTSCTSSEVFAAGVSPIAGALQGARRYLQGLSSPTLGHYVPRSMPGFAPIESDPLSISFPDGPAAPQCRPYFVVLIADGAESCATLAQAETAATALLTTPVDGRTYRIETVPVGLGLAPGNMTIEALAHAGGRADGPGVEGVYAQTDDEIVSEIGALLDAALKVETCNGDDDDCDFVIDEEFPAKGMPCDDGELGACRGTGNHQCTDDGATTHCVITAPGESPSGEICDSIDNDCNGAVDDAVNDTIDHCGQCDAPCLLPNAVPACVLDEIGNYVCAIDGCEDGFVDADADVHNGCEAACPDFTDETCNGVDDDCDGVVDEEDPRGGLPCQDACPGGECLGECTAGVMICTTEGLSCAAGVGPVAEQCNGLDDDCNGLPDDMPEIGAPCAVGDCPGELLCDPEASDVICDVDESAVCDGGGTAGTGGGGADGDADGDETSGCACASSPSPGPGPVWMVLACVGLLFRRRRERVALVSAFSIATLTVACEESSSVNDAGGGGGGGGAPLVVCEPGSANLDGVDANGCEYACPVAPAGAEVCNGFDDDCDGAVDEADAAAGTECESHCPKGRCSGACTPGALICSSGELLCSGGVGPTAESCNGVDDDCDGTIDNGFDLETDRFHCGSCDAPCESDEVCEGNACVPSGCTDGMADLDHDGSCEHTCEVNPPEPEVCNDADDDCDGLVDESHPLVDAPCDDGLMGACKGRGVYECAEDPSAPVACDVTTPGVAPSAEACNAVDDDCNGVVDDGVALGALGAWISLPGGLEIMKYEASRPDADATSPGFQYGYACARAGVMPWTNVTQVEAETACASIGARLCTEVEWHAACSVVARAGHPLALVPEGLFIEAEDYASSQIGTAMAVQRRWIPVVEGYTPGEAASGIVALQALPDTGAAISQAAAPGGAPRLDYYVTVMNATQLYAWARLFREAAGSGSVWIALGPDPQSVPQLGAMATADDTWQWVRTGPFSVTTGLNHLAVWMAQDGVRLDALFVTPSSSGVAPSVLMPPGSTWAYGLNPNIYQPTVCNGERYDPVPGGFNQNETIPTGSLVSCFANWPGAADIHDLSGNAAEWTASRLPGMAAVRGGSNQTASVRCDSAVVSDTLHRAMDVGFRCCR